MIKLRQDYQQPFVDQIYAAWDVARVVLGVLPTGGGKTVCFSYLAHEHSGAVAAVVHRKEILGQISQSLARFAVRHRIVAPPAVIRRIRRRHLKEFGKSFVDASAQAGVVSVQTLTSKSAERDAGLQGWVRQVSLAIFDEGHHYVKRGQWGRGVELFNHAKVLLVTATPERADKLGLGVDSDGFAEIMVEGPSTGWLVKQGYLSRFIYKAPASDLNVDNLPVTASGDFNVKELRKRVVESHLVGDTVSHYQRFADGKRAIVFATDVATAGEIADAFKLAGVPAAALSGETEPGERDSAIDQFERGDLLVLVNVDLFDEGFDVPGVDAVILARPTESLGKFLQMVGRVLRPVYADGFDLSTQAGRLAAMAAGPKPAAVIIDPVRNWERGHGMPDWPRQWTLDAPAKRTRGTSDTIPQRVCLACTQPYEAFYKACPHCGAPVPAPAGRATPEQVEGDLVELDVEAMAALFERMRRADMPDDDYALDQARRGIPAIGRRQDMRRHQAARHRRQVLRELVAWWVGAQAGREQSEVHRRFFHRFGTDIATAFTLNEADTDALISKIQTRFSDDI